MNYPNIIEEHNNLEQRFDNFIQNQLVNLIYPLGSIYMSVNNVSPSTFLGGTWEQIQDTFLLCSGSKYGAGSTGGEETHTLTQAESPAHTHTRGSMEIGGFFSATIPDYHSNTAEGAFVGGGRSAGYNGANYRAGNSSPSTPMYGYDFYASRSWTGATSSVGSNQPHNNMPPYLAVYVWKRTA